MKVKLPKIPIFSTPDGPLSSPSQEHLQIADIDDGIILLKNGGATIILESTSLNFGLLSVFEQRAVIGAYAAFLNSLSFYIQILVRSERKDISHYMDYIDERRKLIHNPKLAKLLDGYKAFISESIKKKNVLGKKFFIIVPFSALELGVAKSALAIAKGSGPLPYTKEYVFNKAKITLYPKRDHVIRQAARVGLQFTQLNSKKLVELVHHIYNAPAPVSRRGQSIDNESA